LIENIWMGCDPNSKMKKFFILLFSLFNIGIFCQDISRPLKFNSLQYDIGINQIKELNLIPLVHSGILHRLSYNYLKVNTHISGFSASIIYSKISTDYEDDKNSFNAQISLTYKYLFEVIKKGKIALFSGAGTELHYSLIDCPNFDESHLYWADYLGVDFANRLHYQFNKNRKLIFCINIPIVMFLSRPMYERQYKIDDVTAWGIVKNMHYNPEFSSWNKSFVMKSELEYQWGTEKKMKPSIIYSYNYFQLQVRNGNAYKNIQHLLGLRLYL
jgi:hypothetical protein